MVRQFLRVSVPLALALVACAQVASAQTKPMSATVDEDRALNLQAYVELLRSDLRTQKVAIITQVMEFTEAEDAKFWPIYREYEGKLAVLNDERMANIKDYAEHFDNLTDAAADKILKTAGDIQGRRTALTMETYEKLKSALSAKTAARFIQVENQILLLLDLQIAASLPVVAR